DLGGGDVNVVRGGQVIPPRLAQKAVALRQDFQGAPAAKGRVLSARVVDDLSNSRLPVQGRGRRARVFHRPAGDDERVIGPNIGVPFRAPELGSNSLGHNNSLLNRVHKWVVRAGPCL